MFIALESLSVDGPSATYAATQRVLFAAQSAAVLEVLHAFVGLVRSPWLVTALQVFSRYGVLWGVLYVVPETQTEQLSLGRVRLPLVGVVEPALGVTSMVIAWCLSEVTRYSFYFCKVRVWYVLRRALTRH